MLIRGKARAPFPIFLGVIMRFRWLVVLVVCVAGPAWALGSVNSPAGFLGKIDFSDGRLIVLSVGAGLGALGVLIYGVSMGVGLLTGQKVIVKGRGVWDKAVYDRAMVILQDHKRLGYSLDREANMALSRWALKRGENRLSSKGRGAR